MMFLLTPTPESSGFGVSGGGSVRSFNVGNDSQEQSGLRQLSAIIMVSDRGGLIDRVAADLDKFRRRTFHTIAPRMVA